MLNLLAPDTTGNQDDAFAELFPPLDPPTVIAAPTDEEARDSTAFTLRQVAQRIRDAGWMNAAREQAADTLNEIAQAIEWGL